MTLADRNHTTGQHGGHGSHDGMSHGGHSWMMMVCCIPMLVIAVVLVAIGVVSPAFIFVALMCTAMMWFMMRAMGHGEQ